MNNHIDLGECEVLIVRTPNKLGGTVIFTVIKCSTY